MRPVLERSPFRRGFFLFADRRLVRFRKVSLRASITMTAALTLLSLAACNQPEDRLSHEDYLLAVQDAEVSDEQFEAVATAGTARQAAAVFAALAKGFADKLIGLNPPEDLDEEHEDLIDAVSAVAELLSESAAEIDEGAGPDLLQTILAQKPEVLAAIRRVDDAIGGLQAIADDRGIDVALIDEEGFTRDAGSNVVAIKGTEYEFIFEESEFTTDITGLTFINSGTQPHEVSFALVPDGFDTEGAVNSPEIEEVAELGFTLAHPGEMEELGFGQPLEPGHYTIVCFVVDPDTGLTHAQLGMFADIIIEPPSTP